MEQPFVDLAIASTPNNIEALPGLLEAITIDVNTLVTGGNINRQQLLIKCRSMVQALETPRETMVKHCWAQVRNQLLIGMLNSANVKDWRYCGPELWCRLRPMGIDG